MPTVIRFFVPGVPATAGSKRAFPFRRKDGGLGVRVTDDNVRGKDWRTAVQHAATSAYDGKLMLNGPLDVRLQFTLPRPKGHFGKRGVLDSAPRYPVVKPDVLKLARAVEDALTGIAWRDDSQIYAEHLFKVYGEPVGVSVTIVEVTPV